MDAADTERLRRGRPAAMPPSRPRRGFPARGRATGGWLVDLADGVVAPVGHVDDAVRADGDTGRLVEGHLLTPGGIRPARHGADGAIRGDQADPGVTGIGHVHVAGPID